MKNTRKHLLGSLIISLSVYSLGGCSPRNSTSPTPPGVLKGTSTSGGGFVQRSNKVDLDETVADIPRTILEVSDWSMLGMTIVPTTKPLSKELSAITSKIFGQNIFTINQSTVTYIQNLKFDIVDKPCYEGTEERDASTPYEMNSPICLSAPRLSRFPKSTLRRIIIPLVFHEVAHHFKFKEPEAAAFQKLADLYLTYRPIYFASVLARQDCTYASETLSDSYRKESFVILNKITGLNADWQKSSRTGHSMNCASRATSAGQNLQNSFNGSLFAPLNLTKLSEKEKVLLETYQVDQDEKNPKFTFLTMIHALMDPGGSPESGLLIEGRKVDPAEIMSLGAKAAMEFIDMEVGRLQGLIEIRNVDLDSKAQSDEAHQ